MLSYALALVLKVSHQNRKPNMD